MTEKPTYEELEKKIQELEQVEFKFKRAEEALQESEGRYRAVVEDMPGLICSFLPGGEITFVNKAYSKYFGKTFEELVGSNFLSLIPESEQKTVMDNISSLKVESPTQSHEHTVIAPNGDIRWQSWSNRALFDQQGKIVGYQSIGMDITERKLAEKALGESEELYRSLFKNNHAIMLLIDPQSADIVDVNPAAISFYGWSYEEFTCKKITDINTLTNEQVFQEMERAKNEQRRQFYFRHRLSSGKIRDVEAYSGPITVKNRKLLYSIIHDITERKRAEEVLLQERNKLQDALAKIKTLSGLLPICSNCKKIRDDKGYWNQIENYIRKHSEAEFSHGLCPECAKRLYPFLDIYKDKR